MDNDRDIEPKLRVLDLLGTAIRTSWVEREPLALLAAIYAVLSLVLIWPARELLTLMRLNPPDIMGGLPPELESQSNEFLAAIAMSLIIWCAIIGIWARLISMGRGAALSGGVIPVLLRSLGIFWRLLEFLGILMAISIIVGLAVGFNPLGIAVLITIVLAAFLLLAGVFGIAAFETASDRGRWLAVIWRDLKGRRGVLALTLLILFLPAIMLTTVMAPPIGTAGGIAFFLFSEWVWGVVSCVWITFSGLVARELPRPAD